MERLLNSNKDEIFDTIFGVVEDITDFFQSLTINDIGNLLSQALDIVVDLGKSIIQSVIDFFVKDLPGLIVDLCKIVFVYIPKGKMKEAIDCGRSALNHFMKILEVLALIPVCALACAVLLAIIYSLQGDFMPAVQSLTLII